MAVRHTVYEEIMRDQRGRVVSGFSAKQVWATVNENDSVSFSHDYHFTSSHHSVLK